MKCTSSAVMTTERDHMVGWTDLHVVHRDVLGVQLVQGVVQVAGFAVRLPLRANAATDIHDILPALLSHPVCLGGVLAVIQKVDRPAGQRGQVRVGSCQHGLLHDVQRLRVAGDEDPDHEGLGGHGLVGAPGQAHPQHAQPVDQHGGAGQQLEDQDEDGVPQDAALEGVAYADVVVEDVGRQEEGVHQATREVPPRLLPPGICLGQGLGGLADAAPVAPSEGMDRRLGGATCELCHPRVDAILQEWLPLGAQAYCHTALYQV